MGINSLPRLDPWIFEEARKDNKSDPELFWKILTRTKTCLDVHHCPFFLAFGTLLGAVREGDFIKGDHDSDIAVLSIHEDRLMEAISEFEAFGLKLVRNASPFLISVSLLENPKQYLDIYVFREDRNEELGEIYKCYVYCISRWRLHQQGKIKLRNVEFSCPRDPETYLDRVYGNWHVPSNKHAES